MNLPRTPLLSTLAVLTFGAAAASFSFRPAAQGLQAVPLCRGLVPFVAESPGGLANSAAVGSANPEILVDSDGDHGHFVIQSILIESDAPNSGFVALSASTLEINGDEFNARTRNLVEPIDGLAVVEAADLMGTPVRTSSVSLPDAPSGGNFPHEIVAESAGLDDVKVTLFARSDVTDLDVSKLRVTGWKRPGHTITVTWLPGN